ncbi:hypothetical protein BHE74_00004263 [Ensete ventricosum]|nr:hypothetical protein GW17_00029318 [Ensete ventricosum]RWW86933.1 hypothetical protein BHE74_00004263 [Ensete ventricosum]
MALHPIGSYLGLACRVWGDPEVLEKKSVGMLEVHDRDLVGVLVTVPWWHGLLSELGEKAYLGNEGNDELYHPGQGLDLLREDKEHFL